MAPDPARPARVLTFALMAVAYAACEVAAHRDGVPRPFGVGYGLFLFALAVAAGRLVPAPGAGADRLPRRVTAALAAVLVLPLAAEPVVRWLTGNGLPLELQLVNGLRNLGLALAAVSAWPKARRLAGVVALFLTLFASAMGDQAAIPYLLAALAVVGGLWLVADHRAGLAGAAVAGAAAEVRRVPLRFPLREAAVFGVLLAAAVGVAAAGPKKVRVLLGELVPTSGGTRDYDPFSRGGVNDGPEETAGDDPTTAGMVDSGTLIETQGPSLIDVASDTAYGRPHKPPKDQERMVAGGVERVKESHKTPENKRPNRDFDTGRQGPSNARKTPGQDARGLFEVEGRTPLHVRVVVYDRYDAADGRWVEAARPNGRLLHAESDGAEWMVPALIRGPRPWYAVDDRHRLKVAELKENLVPTPAMATRFRVRRVNRPDYYEPDYDGVWAFAGRKTTPSGTVVHADCRTVAPDRLPAEAFAPAAFSPGLVEVPAGVRAEVGRLARAWAGDAPRGWPQVAAVLARLRADFAVDRRAAAPAAHPAPVLWFLTESRRGPDYLFATAAALVLRELGHPARVCLGFYASPDAYDPDSDHTPVTAADLHVWPEVLLTDGHWLVVEPTPGYGVLPPLKPWRERVADALAAAGDWTVRNAGVLAAYAAGTVVVVLRRRRLADLVLTLRWRAAPGPTWDRAALRAVRLLECRARLAGRDRADDETLAAWAARLAPDAELAELVGLAEWAAYGPCVPPPAADVPAACRAAVAAWPLARFASSPPGAAA